MAVPGEIKRNPSWVEPALQGLAFWMGYRKQLYRHHDLPEGAMVAELSAIMNGCIGQEEQMECEFSYSKVIDDTDRTLADIVLLSEDVPHTFIEVKRGKASPRLIEDDLKKLLRVRVANPKIKCFLIIGSQGKLPARYVDKNSGKGVRSIQKTSDGVRYKVTRVCKAAASFEKKEAAMYVCLLELV